MGNVVPAMRSSPLFMLAFGMTVSLGCGARSVLDDLPGTAPRGGLGGAGGFTSMTGGAGGVARPPCAGVLDASAPVALSDPGGIASSPALVSAADNGSEVAVFHGFRPNGSTSTALHATSYAWSGNDPSITFTVDPNAGKDFAVSSVSHGNVALALHQIDETDGTDSLALAGLVSPSSPGMLAAIPLFGGENGSAVHLVRGYENPPVAYNIGYLATLAVWDAPTSTASTHSLDMAIGSSGVDIAAGLIGNGDDPLACATAPIAAAAIRAGSSWLLATASGADLGPCDSPDVGPPTSLAIDKIEWGPPDTVTWTVERVTTLKGDSAIEAVRMAAAPTDGGWILVARAGHSELQLIRVGEDGNTQSETDVHVSGETATMGALSVLDGGALVAFSSVEHPDRLHLQLFDSAGDRSASAEPTIPSAFGDASMLASPDGAKSLLAWADDQGVIQTMQIGCGQ